MNCDELNSPDEAHSLKVATIEHPAQPNPLREEPHPRMVAAVKRFGVAGLIVGALITALLRGYRSLLRR